MELDVLARALALRERREPFALATVVWRRAPSSGQLGSKALILADGSMQGWLGGACAQPTVVQEALAAMSDGHSRLLLLGAPDDLGAQPDDGIVKVPMACESEGALEIYLEPVLPAPQIIIIGRSPAVFTLAQLATDLEWEVAVIDDGGDPTDHPRPEVVRTRLDLTGLGVGPASAIVVATQGHYDDLALDAALRTGAGYVGLVSAGKRASATLALLRERGLPDDQLARVSAPAGLDLGRVGNAEIAVAVLAELVARRAAGTWGGRPVEAAAVQARDPICGMTVDPASSRYHATHAGVDHWFCSPGCLAEFARDTEHDDGRP
jgi:xanthine dehydrogenase accessory factor